MISSKEELKQYLEQEKRLYGGGLSYLIPFDYSENQVLLKHIVRLRYTEYYKNTHKKLRYNISKFFLNRIRLKYGFHIPENVCGAGLSIAHVGPIVINKNAVIGDNLRIHVGVNIGGSDSGFPAIGNHVYIGPGAKVFGGIIIASGVQIGANSVVNKDCDVENGVYVGVPSHFIRSRL